MFHCPTKNSSHEPSWKFLSLTDYKFLSVPKWKFLPMTTSKFLIKGKLKNPLSDQLMKLKIPLIDQVEIPLIDQLKILLSDHLKFLSITMLKIAKYSSKRFKLKIPLIDWQWPKSKFLLMSISKFLAKSSDHLKIPLNNQVESSWWWLTQNVSQCSIQVENSSQESPQNSSKWPSWKFLTVITSKFLCYQVEIPLCVINQISLSLTNQMFLWVIKLRVPHSGDLKVPPKNHRENSSQWPSKNLAENVSQLPHQNSLQRRGWIFLSLLSDQVENST